MFHCCKTAKTAMINSYAICKLDCFGQHFCLCDKRFLTERNDAHQINTASVRFSSNSEPSAVES